MNRGRRAGVIFGVIILIAMIVFVTSKYYDPPGPPLTDDYVDREFVTE